MTPAPNRCTLTGECCQHHRKIHGRALTLSVADGASYYERGYAAGFKAGAERAKQKHCAELVEIHNRVDEVIRMHDASEAKK